MLGGIRFWLTSLRYRVSYQLLSQLALPLTYCISKSCTLIILADILKKFNPNVKGYSIGEKDVNAKMNCAVSGAKSEYVSQNN